MAFQLSRLQGDNLRCIVQSYGGLLATRFLLGFAEAGIFPGSTYHRRKDQPDMAAHEPLQVSTSSVFGISVTKPSNVSPFTGALF